MKSSVEFWKIIGIYNEQTLIAQCLLSLFLILSVILSFKTKYYYLLKLMLATCNIFIGIQFFYIIDKSKIAVIFAGPLFLITGLLFIFTAIKEKNDKPKKLNKIQIVALLLILFYPIASYMSGNEYPRIVLYVLPCPFISLSIVLYSLYQKRNKFLEITMILWALTGLPKAFIFNVYEDIILFIIGCYGIYIYIKDLKENTRRYT
jgi:hypothetical protein